MKLLKSDEERELRDIHPLVAEVREFYFDCVKNNLKGD